VPGLFLLLTGGVLQANEKDTRRLRDWPEALQDSPSWPTVSEALTRGTRDHTAWNQAQTQGFTDRAAHHNALLLLELSERLTQGRRFEESLRCLHWSTTNWAQLYKSGYLAALAKDLEPQIPEDATAEIISGLLCPTLEERRQRVVEELRKSSADLDAAAITHGQDWFDVWRTFDPTAQRAAERIRESVATYDQCVSQLVAQKMTRAVSDIDLTTAQDLDIEAPFRLAWSQIEALRFPTPAIAELIGTLISTLWSLRRVGRDTTPAFDALVDLGILLAPYLGKTIKSGESIGQNSRLGDLYVFRAERERGEARREYLVLALSYCPGHRNASMLMSYLHLHDAQVGMQDLAKTIRPASIKTTLKKVHGHLKLAEAAFPLNEDLAGHTEGFQKACLKNKIDPRSFDE
jgi:hypothetical protein